jgi:hypothetical protein
MSHPRMCTAYPQPNPSIPSMYDILAQESNVVAVHLAHVPGTDTYLYEERPSGYHPDHSLQIAGADCRTGLGL